jgi:imidazolonepropionase-like amidohydrolase
LHVPSEYDQVFDLAGKTVMPGLIDMHVHIVGGEPLPYGDYPTSRRLSDPDALHAFRTIDAVRRTLLAGITTIRVMGCQNYIDVYLRDTVRDGLVWGPRVVAAGLGITPTCGHGRWRCRKADGEDEVRRAVREHVAQGVDWVKIMGVTAGMGPLGSPGQDPRRAQYRFEEVQAAVDEAHRWGRPVAVHAHAHEGIDNAVRAGVDSIEHGSFLSDALAERMVKQNIWFVPTLTTAYYRQVARDAGSMSPAHLARAREFEAMGFSPPSYQERMQVARGFGVAVATGTDAGGDSSFRHGSVGIELMMLVECGYSPYDAIMAATSHAARALHLDQLTGSIQADRAADLIVVAGDPLADIRLLIPRDDQKIEGIIADGRFVRWQKVDWI